LRLPRPTRQHIHSYAHLLPFLFDYKATDPEVHRRLTGVSNVLSLDNLDWLYTAGAAMILHCPLVRRVDDDKDHLRGLAVGLSLSPTSFNLS